MSEEVHPLKRRSIKPSSSTVRGMLPGPQVRMLDAAMQSVRSAGLLLEWVWKGKATGWVCSGGSNDQEICVIVATETPPLGQVRLSPKQILRAKAEDSFPKKFKMVLDFPVDEIKGENVYEFPLGKTPERDLFSEFIEALLPIFND